MNQANKEGQSATYLSWLSGLEHLGMIKLKMIYLSLVAMATPLLLLSFWQSSQSLELTSLLRAIDHNDLKFVQYVEIIGEFIARYSLVWIISAMVVGCGYFSLVKMTALSLSGQPLPPLGVLWLRQLPTLIPRGVLTFTILLFLIVMLTNVFARVFGAGVLVQVLLMFLVGLSYAVPIRLCLYRDGPISALRNSFSLSYVKKSKLSKWVVIYQMFTLQLAAALLLYGLADLKELVLQLDKWFPIPRNFIMPAQAELHQHWLYWLSEATYLSLSSLIIAIFAVLSTVFYLNIRREESHA